MEQETWQVVHRFDTEAREVGDFQERCDQYQTDPDLMLSVIPICIMKEQEGQMVNTLTGRRFTSVRFQENIDIRTNETELTDEQIGKKIEEVFGIKLEEPLKIGQIMENLKQEEN